MVGWGSLAAALLGIGVAFATGDRERRRDLATWLAWIGAYLLFFLVLRPGVETRYFVFALPAVAGLVALLFAPGAARRVPAWLGYGALGVALAGNVWIDLHLPAGMVGHDRLAARLARLPERGNVLLSAPYSNDLIFRFRAEEPAIPRTIVRGDRSIAVRVSGYAPVRDKSRMLVETPEQFLDLVARARARYVVTTSPGQERLWIAPDMEVAARMVRSLPEHFAPVDSFHIRLDAGHVQGWVYLWRFRGALPDGPSEITVPIPTAGLTVKPPL
jgi:hypothetical protein